jgi:hypothetical protein
MGRERCLFCGRFIFDGDDTFRPPTLGLTVHRQCYRRDAGLESPADVWADTEPDDDEAEDSGRW